MLGIKPSTEEYFTRLPNGLRVIVSERGSSAAAAVSLAVNIGSKHESKATNGLTHFLEHMIFEGSKKFPTSKELNMASAKIGGNFNATTGVECTIYTMEVPDENLEAAMEMVGDVICAPLLYAEQVDRERNVVTQEVGGQADDPMSFLENVFAKHVLPKHGLGLPVTGSPSGLKKLGIEHLTHLYNIAYHPDNMVLCVATDQSERKILELAQKFFGQLKGKSRVPKIGTPAAFKGPQLSLTAFEGSQAYAIVGGRGPKKSDPECKAFEIAMAALGGSLHARLPVLLRETLGQVYSVSSNVEAFVEAGIFTTSTDCEPKNLKSVLKEIRNAYLDLIKKPLTEGEVELAKNVLVGNSVVSLENLAARSEFLASNLILHGVTTPPSKMQAAMKKITRDEINAAAKKWINAKNIMFACAGPVKRGALSSVLDE